MSTTQLRSSRVKWVNNVKNETHQLLKEFGQEGKERTSAVKLFLTESEKDRLEIFRNLISEIQKEEQRIRRESRDLTSGYKKENKQRAADTRGFLNASEKERLAVHGETMKTIKTRLQHLRQEEKEIIKDARDLMRKIAEENKELATHSETERLAAYKSMMEDLRKRVRELRQETKELLKQFAGEHGTLKTELKKFLSESETTRKRDFNKMMSEVKAVVNEIRDYEREERRLAGAGIKEVPSHVAKKKETPREAKPEKKAVTEGKVKVEAERKKLMFFCKKCGTRHWPFQKCPQGPSSFKKKKIA